MRLLLRDCRVNRLRGCCSIRGKKSAGREKERQTENEIEDGKRERERARNVQGKRAKSWRWKKDWMMRLEREEID